MVRTTSLLTASLTALVLAAGCNSGFGGGGGQAFLGSTTGSTSTSGSTQTTSTVPAGVTLRQLVIETDKLTLSQPGSTQQVQCSGVFSDGRVRDLTHVATWTVQDKSVATLDARGVASPVAAGTTGLVASYQGVTANATLSVAASALGTTTTTTTTTTTASGPTWNADIFPLFQNTLSCNGCHRTGGSGASTRLVLTGSSATDFTQITTSGLIDTKNPASSVLLMKASNATSHGGGNQCATGSAEYNKILAWITAGAPQSASATPAPPTPTPAVAPDEILVNPPVRNLTDAGAGQQIVVLAWWKSTGACLDVTRAAILSASVPAATVDTYGLLTCTGTASVTVKATWMNVSATAQVDFDPKGALAQGDMPSVIVVPAAGGTGLSTSTGVSSTSTGGNSQGNQGSNSQGSTGSGSQGNTGSGSTGSGSTGTGSTGSGSTGSGSTGSTNPTWVTDVFPLLQNTLNCKACHQSGGIGATTATPSGASRMILTFNSQTDFTQITTTGLINTGNAGASVLLVNATGGLSHGGGAPLTTSSAAYQTMLNWIAAGAPMGSTSGTTPAPSPSPLPLSYTNTISVDLASCTVCHARNAVNPQDPWLETYSDVVGNAQSMQRYIYSNGQVGSMGRKSGMTAAQAQQAVADLQAWIAANYPQ